MKSSHLNVTQVVPYIGTWIETSGRMRKATLLGVVPYIGTWIETLLWSSTPVKTFVVPYIGTWIETQDQIYYHTPEVSYLI